jgi:hypothetical protein
MNELPVFDLHLGVNHWATINVTAAADKYIHEAVAVAPADFLQVSTALASLSLLCHITII